MTASLATSPVQMAGLDGALVQFRRTVLQRSGYDVHQVASQGAQGTGARLPHLDRIQAAFGTHDVTGVRAYSGSAADQATSRLGARAYATGDQVVLGRQGMDLHTVAHEAAHVVQQRGGVALKSGIGAVGDRYEQHADAVADAVVAGRSAQTLLDRFAGTGGHAVSRQVLQFRLVEAGGTEAVELLRELIANGDMATLRAVKRGLAQAAQGEAAAPSSVSFETAGDRYNLTMTGEEARSVQGAISGRIQELARPQGQSDGAQEQAGTRAGQAREPSAEGTQEAAGESEGTAEAEDMPSDAVVFEQIGHRMAYGAIDQEALTRWGFGAASAHSGAGDLEYLTIDGGETRLPVIAFKGTLEGQDVVDDTNGQGVGAYQYSANEGDIVGHLRRYGRVDLTGHSLGGAIAQLTAANHPSHVRRVHTYQSPGITHQAAERMRSSADGRAVETTHHIADGDAVSEGGEEHIDGEVRRYDVDSDNLEIIGAGLAGATLGSPVSAVGGAVLGAAADQEAQRHRAYLASGAEGTAPTDADEVGVGTVDRQAPTIERASDLTHGAEDTRNTAGGLIGDETQTEYARVWDAVRQDARRGTKRWSQLLGQIQSAAVPQAMRLRMEDNLTAMYPELARAERVAERMPGSFEQFCQQVAPGGGGGDMPQRLRAQWRLYGGRDSGGSGNVQRKANGALPGQGVHAIAESGMSGTAGNLPYAERIQAAFGRHDVSGVRAFAGGAAQNAASRLGAKAYASGDAVVLGRDGTDLHTVAHEAAHVIQQRGGVSLKSGVGQVGDRYERHADQVADAVVAGRSAEGLLDAYAGTGGASIARQVLQFRRIQAEGARAVAEIRTLLRGNEGGVLMALREALQGAMANQQSGVPDQVNFEGFPHNYELSVPSDQTGPLLNATDRRLAELSDSLEGMQEGSLVVPDAGSGDGRQRSGGSGAASAGRQLINNLGGSWNTVIGGLVETLAGEEGNETELSARIRVPVEGALALYGDLRVQAGRDQGAYTGRIRPSVGVSLTNGENASADFMTRIELSGENGRNGRRVAELLSLAMYNHLHRSGHGAPPAFMSSLVSQMGLAGSAVLAADGVIRLWNEAFGEGAYSPFWPWFAELAWGHRFYQDAVRRLRGAEAAMAVDGVRAQGNASGGEGDMEASVQGGVGVARRQRVSRDADGQVQNTDQGIFQLNLEVGLGPVAGKVEGWVPMGRPQNGERGTVKLGLAASVSGGNLHRIFTAARVSDIVSRACSLIGQRGGDARSQVEGLRAFGSSITAGTHTVLAEQAGENGEIGAEVEIEFPIGGAANYSVFIVQSAGVSNQEYFNVSSSQKRRVFGPQNLGRPQPQQQAASGPPPAAEMCMPDGGGAECS